MQDRYHESFVIFERDGRHAGFALAIAAKRFSNPDFAATRLGLFSMRGSRQEWKNSQCFSYSYLVRREAIFVGPFEKFAGRTTSQAIVDQLVKPSRRAPKMRVLPFWRCWLERFVEGADSFLGYWLSLRIVVEPTSVVLKL